MLWSSSWAALKPAASKSTVCSSVVVGFGPAKKYALPCHGVGFADPVDALLGLNVQPPRADSKPGLASRLAYPVAGRARSVSGSPASIVGLENRWRPDSSKMR